MSQTPPTPPPPGAMPPFGTPYNAPYGYDARTQRRILRDQAKAQRQMLRQQAQTQRDFYRMQRRGLTRRSIVGPILLVSFGVIALMVSTGWLRIEGFLSAYGRFWPLLIVLAGVIMLAEWALDQRAVAEAAPGTFPVRRRVGGGVTFLLILLAAIGVTAHFSQGHEQLIANGFTLNPDNVDQFFGQRHESEESIDRPFLAGNTLSVDNPRGEITVLGTSTDNQIHITVSKQVSAFTEGEAESRAQNFAPKVETNDGRVTVSMPTFKGATADLVITVPETAQATINATRGDIHLSNLKAPVTLTADHGDVDLHDITGTVTAHINHSGSSFSAHDIVGDVIVRGQGDDMNLRQITGSATLEGEFFGDTHAEHISGPFSFRTNRTTFTVARVDGQIDMSPHEDLTADQLVGPTTLNTRSRNIHFDHVAGDVSVTNSNGEVDISRSTSTGDVSITNRNGAAVLTMPKSSGFSLVAEADGGEVTNDFGGPSSSSRNDRSSLTTTVGAGGPRVMINTHHGDITLHEAGLVAVPVPPAPPAPDLPTPAKPAAEAKAAKPAKAAKAAKPAPPAPAPKEPSTPGTVQF